MSHRDHDTPSAGDAEHARTIASGDDDREGSTAINPRPIIESDKSASPAATPVPSHGLPQFIGDYRILGVLGAGGMGVVYEAEQQSPRRRVALKVMRQVHLLDESSTRMFAREIETLGRLKHPNIATIYESGHTGDGQDFFAMELVQGETLETWLARRPKVVTQQELKLRLRMFHTLCDAVHYAHLRGVIHRDLKPSNVIVTAGTETGSGASGSSQPIIKILDFGLARLVSPEGAAASMQTQMGVVMGTLQYMSPEQAKGQVDAIDVRTDVYALGVILYEMLTAHRPYDIDRAAIAEAVRVICEQPPRKVRESWSGVRRLDADVETIVGKALEKSADRRYSSAGALAEDIDRYLTSQPILAVPPSNAYQARMFVRRHRAGVGTVSAIVIVLAAFAAAMAFQAKRIAREAETSRRVSEFLINTFRVSDPSESRGNAITARELLDKASREISTSLEKDPEAQARLMDTMGNAYCGLGLYATAQPLLERALAIHEKALGPDHPSVAHSLNNLAELYREQGKLGEAEPLYRRSLRIWEKALGREHPQVAISLNNLANVCEDQGKYAEAESLYLRSLKIRERVLGPNRPEVAQTLSNLAALYQDQGKYSESEPLLRRSLKIQEETLGPDHPNVASCLNNLGSLYNDQGRYAEAEPLLQRCIKIREKALGLEHPSLYYPLNNLAIAYWQQGRYPEAELVYKRSLRISEIALGPEHPNVATALHNLALLYAGQGKDREAEPLYQRSVKIWEKALGPAHPNVATALTNLASLYGNQRRYADAAPLYQRSFDILEKAFGPDHPDAADALVGLAGLYMLQRKYAEAEPLYHRSLKALEKALGPSHPRTIAPVYSLARLKAREGDTGSALLWLDEVLKRKPDVETLTGIAKDPDLESLRGNPRFVALVAKAEQMAKSGESK